MNIAELDLPSPCYVVDLARLENNLRVIDRVQQHTSAKVLLALKGFAMWSTFDLIRKYLHGVTASSLSEAKLGREHFQREVHVYAPAYADYEIDQLAAIGDHISFNSVPQWLRYRDRVKNLACAIRINPQHSEVKTALYDPCAPGSRLGVVADELIKHAHELVGITGLHFHTLCELNSDALERTLAAVEEKFAAFLPAMSWVNFGGGHHITREDYDVDRLIRLVDGFARKHDVQIYLEPGEAIALHTGYLIATVLDLVHNEVDIAILDTSATAHMPDVLEMPYRPQILGGDLPGKKTHTYRLGGLTCLAGDVIGDYSFDQPLAVGDKLVFTDMAHYTMVKNNTFNGVNLPSIATCDSRTGACRVVRQFGYEDYRNRLS